MRIRPATPSDATAASALLRRSIQMLCVPDHHDDPAMLERWLGNKTPETFRVWLATPGTLIIVAVTEADRLLGVGGLNASGEITLNYVDPAARFQGVSSAMLDWLEHHLRSAGRKECRLTSTFTAHAFYLSRGYADIPATSGPAGGELAMVKAL